MMKLLMVAESNVGKLRKINEDAYGIFEENNLAILCDGMGGHYAGAVASQLAVSTIQRIYSSLDRETYLKIAEDLDDTYKKDAAPLISSVRLANRHVYNQAQRVPKNRMMGTTIAALAFNNNIACVCHVGDSRIYRFCGEKLELLTEDHSWINELIQDNEIRKEDAFQFEHKNVITRALGTGPTVKIDLRLEPACEGDLFLLCSDGLTRALIDDEIRRIIRSYPHDLKKAANQLIESANLKDGSDNITVLLVKILEKSKIEKKINPISITLNNEIDDIISFENKILKNEFHEQTFWDNINKKIPLFLRQKYAKLFIIIGLLLLLVIIARYSTTNHENVTNGEESEIIYETIKPVPNDSVKINESEKTNNQIKNNLEIPEPKDSLKKAIIKNEKIFTKSLKRTARNRGFIYLVGLENLVRNNPTLLYLNGRLLGNSKDFIENGIRVRPGQYNIAVKDSSKKTLYQLNNISISAGDIKAIELNPVSRRKN